MDTLSQNQPAEATILSGASAMLQRPGDYVVGGSDIDKSAYSEMGSKLPGAVSGVIGGTNLSEKIRNSMLHSGGEPLPEFSTQPGAVANLPTASTAPITPTPTKRGRKKKVVEAPAPVTTVTTYTPTAHIPTINPTLPSLPPVLPPQVIDVVFENQFGRIILNVEAVLETPLAYGLVFSSEKEIRFIPNPVEEVGLGLPGKETAKVIFSGIIFTWTDNLKKVMVLVKTSSPEN